MTEYLVHTKGYVNVEAENPEEARVKAQEEVFRGGNEVTSYEAENLDTDERFFQVKIARCGHNAANRTYELMTSKSAMDLMFRATMSMADDFVGEEDKNHFMLDFGVHVLAMFEWGEEELDLDELIEGIRETGERFDEEGMQENLQNQWSLENPEEESDD